MGGVFIKKLVICVWSVTVIFITFLAGAAGADLQCENSQIKSIISNDPADANRVVIEYLPNVFAEIFRKLKKAP